MSLGKLINKVGACDRYRHYTHRPTGPRTARSAGAGPAGLPDWWTRHPRAGAETKGPFPVVVDTGCHAAVASVVDRCS
ncbi:hypothetical protein [Streptomyces enissocaesilis]|uniref:Uncharacterized protein n=1 Tax=Streptomyces enissocaesilis TaxID=332589 RepID=A0ABN3WM89_9ACTN